MNLDHSNVYLKETEEGIIICIEIPDTRNYIHSPYFSLDTGLTFKQDILKQKTGNWNTKIIRDDKYYRVQVVLGVGEQTSGQNDQEIIFHSRKLNLNDAEFEYFTIIQNKESVSS